MDNEKKGSPQEKRNLTEKELELITGGAYSQDNGKAMTITAKTAGIDTQVSAICIGISDKNGQQKAAANSILDSFTKSVR